MSTEEKIRINSEKRIQHSQLITAYLIVYDILAVSFAYFAALWLRFDLKFSVLVAGSYLGAWIKFAPIYAVICILVFWCLRLYKSIWRFASY